MTTRIYYGIGNLPGNSRLATETEALQHRQVRYWGTRSINPSILERYYTQRKEKIEARTPKSKKLEEAIKAGQLTEEEMRKFFKKPKQKKAPVKRKPKAKAQSMAIVKYEPPKKGLTKAEIDKIKDDIKLAEETIEDYKELKKSVEETLEKNKAKPKKKAKKTKKKKNEEDEEEVNISEERKLKNDIEKYGNIIRNNEKEIIQLKKKLEK